jgi:ComF family protein
MSYAPPGESVTRQLWRSLVYFFLPSPCLSCQRPILEPRRAMGLCPPCQQKLARWPEHSCPACGRLSELEASRRECDSNAGTKVCASCHHEPPPYDRLLSLWSYQPPLEEVIIALKFRRLDYLARRLGDRLVSVFAGELRDIDLIVPMPLHWLRHLRRGYNQAWELAQPVAEALGKPCRRLLGRRLATMSQSRLGREARQHNLRRAFIVHRPELCRGRNLLLLDDVVTTGATLRTAASSLKEAGARSITALTVARTPEAAEMRAMARSPEMKTVESKVVSF